MRWINSILGIFASITLAAQLPETDLWLFKLKTEKGQMKANEGKNITSRKGYDNQPYFTPDNNSILYVSVQDEKQSDVYRYDLKKELSVKFTDTKVSEYSPNYTPDLKYISCVVVEEPDSAQRLWLYDLNGKQLKCYKEDVDSVGYYSWFTTDTVLYYKLSVPHSLRMNVGAEDKWLCNSPSRAFKKINGHTFIYAIKDSSVISYRIYNTLLKKSEAYAIHKSSAEDFTWHGQFGLVKSEGSQLLRYNEKEKKWEVLIDLSASGVKKITRFSFDAKTKLLVVVDNS